MIAPRSSSTARVVAAPILAAFAILSAASCSGYRCTDSETLLRFVPKDNVLLILEVQHGIQSEVVSRSSVQQAVDALRAVAAGGRRYPPGGGLIGIDFDAIEAPDAMEPQRAAAFREVAAAVHVDECGLYVDDQGRLSFFRLTRLERCNRLLAIANDWINREESGPDKDSRPFTPDFPILDEASWKLVRAAVGSAHRWLSVENDAIVIDIPMTEANAARCLAWIVDEGRKTPNAEALQFFEQITSLEVTGGRARLRFGEEPRPVMRFVGRPPDQDYDGAVQRRLVELGVELGGADAPTRARARLEGATRPK